jgi:hypothetical protein
MVRQENGLRSGCAKLVCLSGDFMFSLNHGMAGARISPCSSVWWNQRLNRPAGCRSTKRRCEALSAAAAGAAVWQESAVSAVSN